MALRKALVSVCFSAYFVAACVAPPGDAVGATEDSAEPPEKEMQKPETMDERRELRQQLADRDAKKFEDLENVRANDVDPVIGEVPDDTLDKIIEDLRVKIDADRADIEVLHAESLIWNDGSLGCGRPGQVYTQALVPGYRVILGHKGQQFDYRATEKGYFMLCEQAVLAAPGAGSDPPVQ